MDVEQAVGSVRVVRQFLPEPLSDDDLNAILDAGRRTGSSKNLQRWQFIVVRDRDRLEQLAKVGNFAGHLAGAPAAVALVTPDPRAANAPLSVTFDIGRAAQNMVLVAWGRGIGSAPATVYDQMLCRQILGYPADQHCEYIVDFGRPADATEMNRRARRGGRLTLPEVVRFEHW